MSEVSRPLMNYYGGKWRLAPWILDYIPPHGVYVEVFGGGLSVFMQKSPAKVEVVNDKSQEIVALYRHVRGAAHHLALLLDLTPYAREEFYSAKDRSLSIESTRRTLVASFMGVGNSLADSSNGFRNSASSNVSPSLSWTNYVSEFERFHNRLRGTIVECLDYKDIFNKYDSPETLWYLDPPYVFSTRSVQQANRAYNCELTDDDHRDLIERIQTLAGMVLLSGYENEIYKSLPWKCVTRESRTQRNGTRVEMLWMNNALVKAQAQQPLL